MDECDGRARPRRERVDWESEGGYVLALRYRHEEFANGFLCIGNLKCGTR